MHDQIKHRPLNVSFRHGSSAAKIFRSVAGLPEQIAKGLHATPAHDLHFHGGRTIQKLHFANFYVGADAWAASDIDNINHALAAAMSDAHLNNVMQQYFPDPISSAFDDFAKLSGGAPSVVSQGDVEALVTELFSAGKLAASDLSSTVFNFLLPPGTVLNADAAKTGNVSTNMAAARSHGPVPDDDEDDSLHGLGGYHGSVHTAGKTVYYAVGVFSETRADGTENGIPVFDQSWKNVVATFYHELNEARTDADVEDAINAGNNPAGVKFLGWTSKQGEECGDFPVFEANPLTKVFKEVPLANGPGTVPVQFQYSNAVHGPEGPIKKPHPFKAKAVPA